MQPHPQEALLQPGPGLPRVKQWQVAERRLARRSNWESASPAFGRIKTRFQLYRAATVASLTWWPPKPARRRLSAAELQGPALYGSGAGPPTQIPDPCPCSHRHYLKSFYRREPGTRITTTLRQKGIWYFHGLATRLTALWPCIRAISGQKLVQIKEAVVIQW